MNKKLSTLLGCGLISLLLFSNGCGASAPAANSSSAGPTAAEKKIAPVKVTLAGGSVGGSWSAIGEAIGETIRRVAPGSSFGYQPGQDGANAITVISGQAELGFLFSTMAKAAYEGTAPYKEKMPDLRAIGTFGPLIYQTIATEKSGIKTYADMKNKPIVLVVNTKDSTQEVMSRAVLEEHGLSYEDIIKNGGQVQFLPSNAGLDLMKNGRADVRIGMQVAPEAKVAETATTTKLVLVQSDAEAIKNIIAKYPVKAVTIPKNAYTFQTADNPTFEVPLTVVVSKNLSDDIAYTVAKAIIEQFDYLKSVVPGQLEKDTAQSITKNGIPLHPGAEKYYKEKGLLK